MMLPDDPIDLLYRTRTTRPRQGPYGWLMRRVAAHPLWSGLIGGLLAVGVAVAQGWRGVQTMPEVAVILCGLVVLVWCVLFFLMRGFFASQIDEHVEVVRRLQVSSPHGLVWSQGSSILAAVEEPSWRLCRAEREPARKEERPCPVWLVVTSARDPAPRLERAPRFVLETRVSWEEARDYPMEHHDADELLPSHIASPLLELGRASMRRGER